MINKSAKWFFEISEFPPIVRGYCIAEDIKILPVMLSMAADLIECSDESLKGIIYNIIYCGMKRKSDEITDKIITAVK